MARNIPTIPKDHNQFYIYAEDLASALIGPFKSRDEANNHVLFQYARGDASAVEGSSEVISGFIACMIPESEIGVFVTAEEDRVFDADAVVEKQSEQAVSGSGACDLCGSPFHGRHNCPKR